MVRYKIFLILQSCRFAFYK